MGRKSGNFVGPEKWEPCSFNLKVYMGSRLQRVQFQRLNCGLPFAGIKELKGRHSSFRTIPSNKLS